MQDQFQLRNRLNKKIGKPRFSFKKNLYQLLFIIGMLYHQQIGEMYLLIHQSH